MQTLCSPSVPTLSLLLRVGMGMVFVFGGWSKLAQLLDPARSDAMVATYLGSAGYIDAFFQRFLFSEGSGISPFAFLFALSAFEFLSGLLLIVGLLVRPLALLYGLLFWTFMIALPVVTAPDAVIETKTHLSPAFLVMIRDLALSGICFVLYRLGPGRWSIDECSLGPAAHSGLASTKDAGEAVGLLLRLALAAPFVVGGLFHGMDHIQTWATSAWILLPAGLFLISGIAPRLAGGAAFLVVLWFIWTRTDLGAPLIANLNAYKREFAFLAAAIVYATLGGGDRYSLRNVRGMCTDLLRPGASARG